MLKTVISSKQEVLIEGKVNLEVNQETVLSSGLFLVVLEARTCEVKNNLTNVC